MRPPVIGITTYREQARWSVFDRLADVQSTLYTDGIADCGAAVVLLPPIGPHAIGALHALDALVVSGGADVDPAVYAAEPHPAAGPFRADRDGSELALVQAAVEQGLPVLGICRGMQLLNVALGGSLVQHLPDQVEVLPHQGAPGVFTSRSVSLFADSWLAGVLGSSVTTACHHHQAVDRLGAGLRLAGVAEDGTPEAVEAADGSPVIGVQWHPEQLADGRLFEAFVQLVRARLR